MVNQALWNLGVDPQEATDPEGWRHLSLGTAHGLINIIEWEPGLHFLAVWSPILRAPEDPRLRAQLFETLLQLNHRETGMARYSLKDDLVIFSFVRPIHGLDLNEVLDAIRMVMMVADTLDEYLQSAFEIAMPQIKMDDATWLGVLDVLRLCDAHTQAIFKCLMEGWVAQKGVVDTGKGSIGLCSKSAGEKTLAALIGYASAGPLATIGWDSLERGWGIRPDDAAVFKQAVPRPKRFKTTESSANLPVDESFTEAMADQLLDALVFLEKALQRAVPPKPELLPNLEEAWGLKLKVGKATQHNVHALLTACPPAVREVYIKLIQGWYDAGQKLYTNKPDRVYLRLTVRQSAHTQQQNAPANKPDRVYLRLTVDDHTFALCTLYGPQKKRAARIELSYPLTYYFDTHLEARRRYEQAVAQIPGFSAHKSGARIPMGEEFTTEEAGNLLKVLHRLAEDVRT
jgi:hypothetical protein